MQKLLLLVFLLFSSSLFAQRGFLYVKKKGYKKVRTFEEGSLLKFSTRDDQIIYGGLALVKKDSILVNNNWFAPSNIKTLYLREDHYQFDSHTFWLTTAGVALATAGITLAGWTSFGKALGYSAAIGYGNFLVLNFPSLKRKKYSIGKKYTLQTLDLHF
ncbi:MAG: hypothetical protein ACXVLT_12395 [Flavisolibacter sp.]